MRRSEAEQHYIRLVQSLEGVEQQQQQSSTGFGLRVSTMKVSEGDNNDAYR